MSQTNQPGLSGADDLKVQKALDPNADSDIPLEYRAKDPVCGTYVDTRNARFTTNYLVDGGVTKTFYFTSDECKQLFEREPEKYSSLYSDLA
jgi:YHS domain-containing protein